MKALSSCGVCPADDASLDTKPDQRAIAGPVHKVEKTTLACRRSLNDWKWTLSRHLAELHVIQPRVETIFRHEFVVRSQFHDLAVFENGDAMRDLDRAEPVGNHDRCTILHQPVKRLLHQPFRFAVE